MGVFRLECEVVSIIPPNNSDRVPEMLVDTGSELTWISEQILTHVGVTIAKSGLDFLMANGATITRSTGYAILRCSGFETVDEVVFGQPGDLSLLGARTLEGFGASVDPGLERLVAAGPHPVAPAGVDR